MKKLIISITLLTNLFANDINEERLLDLDKQNKALFSEVKNYTDELLTSLKKKENIINKKLDKWSKDFDSVDGKEINKAMKDAISVAKANKLNTVKLQKMFKLSKRVILRSEFKKYDGDTKSSTAKKFDEWLDWAILGEEKIARDALKIQRQRVVLYKKVNIAFIRALIQKDSTKALSAFKKYAQSLQKIQSADAQILIAQANNLVAEQQLVNDAISVVPFVGDALDITSIINGEDITGRKLSNLEKGFSLVLLLTPNILEQLIKRNPAVAQALGKVSAKLDAIKDVGKEKLSNLIPRESILKITSKLKGNRDIDIWRLNYYKKIREQKKLAKLSNEAKEKLIKKSSNNLDELNVIKKGDRDFADNASFSDDTVEKISQVANKRDEIFITRPGNKDAVKWIEQGASTKDMFVKGKSAERHMDNSNGVFAGLIPEKQKYSKLTDSKKIHEFQLKVNKSLKGEISYVRYSKEELKRLKKDLSKKEYIELLKQQRATPMVSSRQLTLKKNKIEYKAVELPKKSGDTYTEGLVVYTHDGKYFDEHLKEIKKTNLDAYDLTKKAKFKVLTDLDGNLLTADLDLLAVGTKKKTTIMQNDYTMGNINSNEMESVSAINKATKDPRYPNQRLVHHGGENSFINSQSKPDFPSVGYARNGETIVFKNEKQLKVYYHNKKLQGYNLEPNPFWGWGEWDPTVGYK